MIVEEIISKYSEFKVTNLEDEDNLWLSAQIPNSYKLGDYKSYHAAGFNLEQALKAYGVVEGIWEELIEDEPPRTAMAVTRNDLGKFAIRENNSIWRYSIIHEAGHIVLKHGGLTRLDMVMGLGYLYELEAEVFTYLVHKKLGIEMEPLRAAMLVTNVDGYTRKLEAGIAALELNESKVQSAVDDFLMKGGLTN